MDGTARQPVVLCTLPMHESGKKLINGRARVVVLPDNRPETFYRELGEADILLVRSKLPDDIFEHDNHLLGVVRNGTGLDMIPMRAATAHNIPVANVPAANVQAVVEYCVGSFLLLARRLDTMNSVLREKDWESARALSAGTSELAGKTLGVVGVGAIGSKLARVCRDGFGMRVLGYQPERHLIPDFIQPSELDQLLAESDFISLHCPLVEQTRHLINDVRLSKMKRTSVLVNASRGAVVDDQALARALRERRIAGAAIDVFADQPLPRDHPFLSIENINLTPHAAALTDESSENMSVGAAKQILQLLSGERPEHLVNPEIWEDYLSFRSSREYRAAAIAPIQLG